MKVITLFFLVIIFPLEAQDSGIVRESLGKPISLRFIDGRHLIYECDDKHYVCVDEDGYEKCQFIRKNRKISQFENLGCAPLKIFTTRDEFFEKQKKMIASVKDIPFCFQSSFQ